MDILNESCPQNSSFLEAWLTCQKFILETFSTDGHDPDTRGFEIVTGNCSGIQGTHENRTVRADKDDQLVGCQFDGYITLAMLGAGDKIFRAFSPLTLSMSPKTNANNPNERHDIDTLFCEVGEWYLLP